MGILCGNLLWELSAWISVGIYVGICVGLFAVGSVGISVF